MCIFQGEQVTKLRNILVSFKNEWGNGHRIRQISNNSDGQKLTKKLPTKSLTNFLVRPIYSLTTAYMIRVMYAVV